MTRILLALTGMLLVVILVMIGVRSPIPIRIAYSSQTAIHAHLGQVFERTDILRQCGLQATVIPAARGNLQADLLREGKVDVAFTCDVPTILNLQTQPDLRIVGTPGPLGKVRLLVPTASSVRTLSDLKGAVAVKKGSVAHRFFLRWCRKAPAVIARDFSATKEDVARALDGDCAAVVSWDPIGAELVASGKARALAESPYFSHVVVRQDYLRSSPAGVRSFLSALRTALCYIGTHRQEVSGWAAEISGFTVAGLDLAAQANPWAREIRSPEAVDLDLKPADVQTLEDCARFAREQGLVEGDVDVRAFLAGGFKRAHERE